MEKKKRIAIILWALFLFFLACLILILFSIKIYLYNQIEAQKSSLAETEREFLESKSQEFQEKIDSANSIFKELSFFYQQKVYFSEILQKISVTLPQDCYLINLSMIFFIEEKKVEGQEGEIQKIKEKSIKISLSGFAPLREDLLKLKKNLENEEQFKKVYFPAANWVEAENINFNITFQISL